MHKDELAERARRHAQRSREHLQIAERIYDLLPATLRSLKQDQGLRGAKGDRKALTHPDYLEKLNQYVDVLGDGLSCRIQSETHRMLLQAWQSLNSFERARRNPRDKR
jgi:hypothetical protein